MTVLTESHTVVRLSLSSFKKMFIDPVMAGKVCSVLSRSSANDALFSIPFKNDCPYFLELFGANVFLISQISFAPLFRLWLWCRIASDAFLLYSDQQIVSLLTIILSIA